MAGSSSLLWVNPEEGRREGRKRGRDRSYEVLELVCYEAMGLGYSCAESLRLFLTGIGIGNRGGVFGVWMIR